MKNIYILSDYKNNFGSKWNANPYRSGMDKAVLKQAFEHEGVLPIFEKFSDVDFQSAKYKNQYVLYTSSEDIGYYYKDYIEDIILGLSLNGAIMLPAFAQLRANNNKVFMEILRQSLLSDLSSNIHTKVCGVLEDLHDHKFSNAKYVLKTAQGAMSRGVALASSPQELWTYAKKMSRSSHLLQELKDYIRTIYYKGYIQESRFRKKFIVQNFIPSLTNDWKVLVFGKRYYILKRPNRKNDFRASGSKKNYAFGEEANGPKGIFEFAQSIKNKLDTPLVSLDIGYNGKEFFLLEFQSIYFGSSVQYRSDCYFEQVSGQWVAKYERLPLETVYAQAVCDFMQTHANNLNSTLNEQIDYAHHSPT